MLLMGDVSLIAGIVNDVVDAFGKAEFLIDEGRNRAPASEVSLPPSNWTAIFL